MNSKRFFITTVIETLLAVAIIGTLVIIVDPYFHYHKPLKGLKYALPNEEIYTNDGIIRNFDYDGVIIGSSMIRNYKNSKFDRLFGVKSIKIPYDGAPIERINRDMEKILSTHPDVKYILRSVEEDTLLYIPGNIQPMWYPEYLYDNNIFNDYLYILNKRVIFSELKKVAKLTLKKQSDLDFDKYLNWEKFVDREKADPFKFYDRGKKDKEREPELSEDEIQRLDKYIEQNLLKIPKEYPDTKFIYFFAPYSILHWDRLYQEGDIKKMIEVEKYTIEKILTCDNIELYGFYDNYDMITNMKNYRDQIHHYSNISDSILEWIHEGKHRLTKENYMEYLNKNREFYVNYDYDSIFNKK